VQWQQQQQHCSAAQHSCAASAATAAAGGSAPQERRRGCQQQLDAQPRMAPSTCLLRSRAEHDACCAVASCACAAQVVVHNLPWTTTWQQLKDLFKEWKVDRADVVYDSWGKSRCAVLRALCRVRRAGVGRRRVLPAAAAAAARPWRQGEAAACARCGSAPAVLCLPRNILTRTRGFGTVRFTTAEDADAACQKLNNSEYEGRTITVRLDRFA
jgi:hypothetical protein